MDWMRRYGWRLAAAVSLILALVSALEPRGFRRQPASARRWRPSPSGTPSSARRTSGSAREVEALRSEPAAIERAAREELGFVRPGEIVIHLE